MRGFALVQVDRSCRLSICMAEGDTKCISWLIFFLSSKIDADQMKITNHFPFHHDRLSQFSESVTTSPIPQKGPLTYKPRQPISTRRGEADAIRISFVVSVRPRAVQPMRRMEMIIPIRLA